MSRTTSISEDAIVLILLSEQWKNMVWRPPRVGIFSRVRTRQDALDAARALGAGFSVVTAILVVQALVISSAMILDAMLFGLYGYLVRVRLSRFGALLATMHSALLLLDTIEARTTGVGGRNVILPLLVLFSAARSLEVTMKLHGGLREDGSIR